MSYIILIGFILYIVGSAIWSPGTILLLDYVLTPHAPINWYEPIIFPIMNTFVSLIGTEWVSKIFFISILMMGAYLGILLARSIQHNLEYYRYPRIMEVFGGIFFIINPFIYERMMVQPTIALGIFLLGYSIYFLYFSHRIIMAGMFAGLAFVMMPHASYMIALIFGLYLIFSVRSRRDLGYMIISGIIIIVMNLNWILAPFFGRLNSVSTISSFSLMNLEAFRTQALAPLDVWGTNILLYGFWGERYSNHYANVGFLSSLWYIAGLLFLLMVGFGLYRLYRTKEKVVGSLLILGALSLVFGIGIASSITAGLTTWMVEHIPLWQGYREPQKWIGLLMIVEGIGFLVGLGYILEKWGRDLVMRGSIIVSIGLIFLIWSPGPLMGYHSQLRTTLYPPSFEVFRTEMLPSFSGKILALPWHSYIGCQWIKRPIVANPIGGLLSPLPIVVSDNIEVGDILYSNSQTTQSRDIERFLGSGDTTLLRDHGFTHIFLMRSCASSSQMEDILSQGVESGSLIQERQDDDYIFYRIQ